MYIFLANRPSPRTAKKGDRIRPFEFRSSVVAGTVNLFLISAGAVQTWNSLYPFSKKPFSFLRNIYFLLTKWVSVSLEDPACLPSLMIASQPRLFPSLTTFSCSSPPHILDNFLDESFQYTYSNALSTLNRQSSHNFPKQDMTSGIPREPLQLQVKDQESGFVVMVRVLPRSAAS